MSAGRRLYRCGKSAPGGHRKRGGKRWNIADDRAIATNPQTHQQPYNHIRWRQCGCGCGFAWTGQGIGRRAECAVGVDSRQ